MMNKKKMSGVIGLLIVISLAGIVLASTGLSSDYHRGNPLKVAPGSAVNVVFGRLQNTGISDIVYDIELIEGDGIATLTDRNLDNFVVPAGSTNTPIHVRIAISEDIASGASYDVTIRYKDVTPSDEGGMVTITDSSTSTLPVLVEGVAGKIEEEEAEKGGFGVWWWVLGIAVVIVIVWIVFKMMNGNSIPKK